MNRIVLLSDGGIESLVTAGLILVDAKHRASPTNACTLGCPVNHSIETLELDGARKECIRAQASLIDSEQLEFMACNASLLSVLARAIELAGPQGTIYWPVCCGEDAVFLEKTMDTMLGVVHLNTLITESKGPELLLPLIDLDQAQIAEMACELDAPVQSGWPCNASCRTPCVSCPSCIGWDSALSACGLTSGFASNRG